MALTLDSSAITHGIQLAVAPVFLLTAVSGMIGAVAGRLARIIDRARVVEDRARANTEPEFLARAYNELADLRLRGRLANGCIGLLTFCAFLIGITIILLFLGETTNFQSNRLAVAGFLAGVASFLLALVCFLTETMLATRLLNFHMLQQEVEGKSHEVVCRPGRPGLFDRIRPHVPRLPPARGAVHLQAEQAFAHRRRHRARIP